MDLSTAQKLNALTKAFYDRAAPSFSATREQPWPGWETVAGLVRAQIGAAGDPAPAAAAPHHGAGPLRVLDLACGNLRFERFLAEALPGIPCRFRCVDSCEPLARAAAVQLPTTAAVRFQNLDIMEALEQGALAAALSGPPFGLAVCFGFLHHIPLAAWRAQLLQALVDRTAPGGLVAVSFWQFLGEPRLAAKAATATHIGAAHHGIAFDDPGDRLLGWQDRTDLFRYCHSFTEAEIDRLVAATAGAREAARFSADGRAQLNRYVVLRRTGSSATSIR